MKIALITDQHFGARDDDQNFDRYFERFYNEVFFPYLLKHNIKTVIGLGDLFDRRKYINFQTLSRCKDYYFDWYDRHQVKKFSLVGNHDVFYKNTNRVNSQELVLTGDYVIPIANPGTYKFEGIDIFLVPWINSENRETVKKMIAETPAQVCFGHFEFNGFEMYRGVRGSGMADASEYAKFDIVCSGHYHHKSSQGNVHYLGAPYEMNWLDFNDPRGFHVFDTETRQLEYIENPLKMFAHFYYNDEKATAIEQILPHPEEYEGKIVKVVVIHKTKPLWFDTVIASLEQSGTLKIQVVEDHHNLNQITETELLEELGDTFQIIRNYIQGTDSKFVPQLEQLFEQLYVQAQASAL